ncbi:hypothetical protein D3C81_1883370 [compost metagenome]
MPHTLGNPEFRLERPAIVAQVNQPAVVVLAQWRRDRQAGADDHILLVAGELGQGHRRGAIQVDREAKSWIDQPGDITFPGFTGQQG